MLIDLTYPVSVESRKNAENNEKKVSIGHVGTHFDVMDKEFPLDFLMGPSILERFKTP